MCKVNNNMIVLFCTNPYLKRHQNFHPHKSRSNLRHKVYLNLAPTRRQLIISITHLLIRPLFPKPSYSLQNTQNEVTIYDSYSKTYDQVDGTTFITRLLGFDSIRSFLLSQARGDVAELCVGTGINLVYYKSDQISSLTGVDISKGMLNAAEKKASNKSYPITLLHESATSTSLPDQSFDTIVLTFALCVVDEPINLLKEAKRLLKKNGRLLIMDYSESTWAPLASYQHLVSSVVRNASKGCRPDLRVIASCNDQGFRVVNERRFFGGSLVALELELKETAV